MDWLWDFTGLKHAHLDILKTSILPAHSIFPQSLVVNALASQYEARWTVDVQTVGNADWAMTKISFPTPIPIQLDLDFWKKIGCLSMSMKSNQNQPYWNDPPSNWNTPMGVSKPVFSSFVWKSDSPMGPKDDLVWE